MTLVGAVPAGSVWGVSPGRNPNVLTALSQKVLEMGFKNEYCMERMGMGPM